MKRNGKGVEGEEERGRDSASRRGSAAAGETTSGRGSGIGGGSGSGSGDDPETVYRAMLRRSALQMLAGSGSLTGNLGLRFGGTHHSSPASLPNGGSAAAAAAAAAAGGGGGSSGQGPDSVRRLSVDECWKLILELGTRWPAWNEATALQATLAARKENNEAIVASTDGGHHLHASDERDNSQQHPQQEFLKRLANRALDALAAQPPSHSSHHGGFFTTGMQAPKQTTQGRLDSRVAAPEAPTISTPPFQKPSRATISSRDMPAPRAPMTRPSGQELTIFYDGIVNVCDNVPPDKARLIMLFAEKAGLTPQTQKPPRFTPPAPQPSPAPQATPIAAPAAVAGSSIPMDLHESKPIPTKVPLLVGSSPLVTREPARTTPPIAHDPTHAPPLALARPRAVEGPSSRVKPPIINEALERAKQALAQGKASMAIKNTTGTPSKPRQVRPNVMLKPLPNARRNSLARFLDSRKRQSTSEEVPSKKPNLGEGSQSDAEDSKGIGKPLFSQSSKELKEEDFLTSNKNVVDQAPSKSR